MSGWEIALWFFGILTFGVIGLGLCSILLDLIRGRELRQFTTAQTEKERAEVDKLKYRATLASTLDTTKPAALKLMQHYALEEEYRSKRLTAQKTLTDTVLNNLDKFESAGRVLDKILDNPSMTTDELKALYESSPDDDDDGNDDKT